MNSFHSSPVRKFSIMTMMGPWSMASRVSAYQSLLSQNASLKPCGVQSFSPCSVRKWRNAPSASRGAYGTLDKAAVGEIVPVSSTGECAT